MESYADLFRGIELVRDLLGDPDQLIRHRHEGAVAGIEVLDHPGDTGAVDEQVLDGRQQRLVLQTPDVRAAAVVAAVLPADLRGLVKERLLGVALEGCGYLGGQLGVAVVEEALGVRMGIDETFLNLEAGKMVLR